MSREIFDVLQNEIHIESRSEIVTHPKGYKEKGFKFKYDMWTIVKGHIHFTYNDSLHVLKSGDLFLMYPGVMYEAKLLEETTFVYSKFELELNRSIAFLDQFSLDGYLSGHDFEALIKSFIACFSGEGFMQEFKRNQYFHLILISYIERKLDQSLLSRLTDFDKLRKIMPAIESMHDSYNKSLSIHHYSLLCGMSEKYFITYFKSVLGLTPHKYIMHIRMQKAVHFLRERSFTIKEIAYKLGYSDPYNFSVAFKKHFKVAPSKYIE